MKPWMLAIIITALAGALGNVFVQNQRPQSTPLPTGAVIYDVRTADEYAAGHVANATLFPLTDLQSGKLPSVPKDTPIAVYCRSGKRSAMAATILQKAGYKNIIDMHGIADAAKYGLLTVN